MTSFAYVLYEDGKQGTCSFINFLPTKKDIKRIARQNDMHAPIILASIGGAIIKGSTIILPLTAIATYHIEEDAS